MAQLRAVIPTTQASRYLQQLCKHWSHRFPVEFDPARGAIQLAGASLALAAKPDELALLLTSADADALPRLSTVVTEHLQRFAFREQLEVQWAEAA